MRRARRSPTRSSSSTTAAATTPSRRCEAAGRDPVVAAASCASGATSARRRRWRPGFDCARGRVIVPDGRRSAERSGRHPAAAREARGGLRRRLGLAQEPAGQGAHRGALPSKIANWLIGRVTGVRLHDYGCTLKAYRREVARAGAALRRDAPLHPGLREVVGRAHHRAWSCATTRASEGEVQVRPRPHAQGGARPHDREVPGRLLDEADLPLRRLRASSLCFGGVSGRPSGAGRQVRRHGALRAPQPAAPAGRHALRRRRAAHRHGPARRAASSAPTTSRRTSRSTACARRRTSSTREWLSDVRHRRDRRSRRGRPGRARAHDGDARAPRARRRGAVASTATSGSASGGSRSSTSTAGGSRSRTRTAPSRLVFNGEIYNFRELRAELEARGPSLRDRQRHRGARPSATRSTALDCLERLNGMFAFAIWDARARPAVRSRATASARSRSTGRSAAGGLLFASELKALLAHPGVPDRARPDALAALPRATSTCPRRGRSSRACTSCRRAIASSGSDGRVDGRALLGHPALEPLHDASRRRGRRRVPRAARPRPCGGGWSATCRSARSSRGGIDSSAVVAFMASTVARRR